MQWLFVESGAGVKTSGDAADRFFDSMDSRAVSFSVTHDIILPAFLVFASFYFCMRFADSIGWFLGFYK